MTNAPSTHGHEGNPQPNQKIKIMLSNKRRRGTFIGKHNNHRYAPKLASSASPSLTTEASSSDSSITITSPPTPPSTSPPTTSQSSFTCTSQSTDSIPNSNITTSSSQSSTSTTIDSISNPSAFGPKGKHFNFIKQAKIRTAIDVYFTMNFYDTYSPDELPVYVKIICEAFKLHCHSTVKNVIMAVKNSLDNDEEYDATRKTYIVPSRWKIQPGGFEEHLVTKYKEQGASYYNTMKSFNATHQAEEELPRVGLTAIYNAIQRTNHIIASTTSIPQTNKGNLFHRQARYNWFCQLLVRMGQKLPTPEGGEENEFRKRLKPEWVDENKLKSDNLTFVPERVGFWDEIHIYQVVGSD